MPNTGKAVCPQNSHGERSGESSEEDSDQHGDPHEVRESYALVPFGSESLSAAAGDSGNGEVGEAPTASGVGPGPAPLLGPVLAPDLIPETRVLVEGIVVHESAEPPRRVAEAEDRRVAEAEDRREAEAEDRREAEAEDRREAEAEDRREAEAEAEAPAEAVEGGVGGGGAVVPGGGAVLPGGGGPPVAGAPGAAGSSSQGRKSTLPVQRLVHAFHCTNPACQQKTCAGTKQVLKRMEVHVQQCPTRRAQQSAQQGGPPPQQAECKVCKLWQLLRTPAAPPPPTTTEAVAPAEAVEVGEASAAPPAAPPPPTPNEAEAEAEAEEDTFGGFLREEYTFGGYEGGFPRP
jgi:hypothetical protein